jgi:uncharacterized protein (DUF4415 family)
MQTNDSLGEERLAGLLSNLPPAPVAWVERAARIPRVQRDLGDVQRRLDEDALLREAFRRDGERALRDAGLEIDQEVLEHLRNPGRG